MSNRISTYSTKKQSALLALILLTAAITTGVLLPSKAAAGESPQAIVTELMTREFPNIPGKEGVMILVTYPPGVADPVHRHDAHAFVYVLEGSIVMGLKGGKEVTLTRGQTFYEGPNDVHVVGRNASKTKPAKFVVTLVKEKNAPILTPTQG